MLFRPCTGRCTDEGSHCEGCGRSHKDIAELRSLVKPLVNYAKSKGYENTDEFAQSVAKSLAYKLDQ